MMLSTTEIYPIPVSLSSADFPHIAYTDADHCDPVLDRWRAACRDLGPGCESALNDCHFQRRNRPPEPYLRLARFSPDQMRKLRGSYWLSQQQLDLEPALLEARPLYLELFRDQIRG